MQSLDFSQQESSNNNGIELLEKESSKELENQTMTCRNMFPTWTHKITLIQIWLEQNNRIQNGITLNCKFNIIYIILIQLYKFTHNTLPYLHHVHRFLMEDFQFVWTNEFIFQVRP